MDATRNVKIRSVTQARNTSKSDDYQIVIVERISETERLEKNER